jgi:hypothetical protein
MYLILFLFSISCGKRQDTAERHLRAFINDVVSKELNNDELINKYLCKNSQEDKAKVDGIISMQIDWLRKDLLSMNVRDISYKKYSELTPTEQNLFLDSDLTKNNIIVAYHRNKKIRDFLVVNNKVASLGTMNKGGTLIFLKFCRD